jgi:hypothetical protein
MAEDVSHFYPVSDIVDSVHDANAIGFMTTRANKLSEWGAMGGNLTMRLNQTYVLSQHDDYLEACAWGLITIKENAAEIAADPYTGEQAVRACKHVESSQEEDVVRTVRQLLERKRNL